MKSARLTILLSPEEKAAIETRATALGLSSSEFARRAVEAYESDPEAATLRLLAQELAVAIDQAEAKIDDALAAITDMRTYFSGLGQGQTAREHDRQSA